VGFSERLRALLGDTWNRVEPYVWQTSGMSVAGGLGALVLFWFLKKVVIALAYSVVGATGTLMGVQTVLLGLDVQVLPMLDGTRWAAPGVASDGRSPGGGAEAGPQRQTPNIPLPTGPARQETYRLAQTQAPRVIPIGPVQTSSRYRKTPFSGAAYLGQT
jgi:hypothetical protein